LRKKLTLVPLVASAYFMVAGGPYGLEEILGKSGIDLAVVILLVTPLVWSVPITLMVGELSAALPQEGGYYVWVKRAFGPFWGFQEAWLSLCASVFDMAIYPTLFVLYLGRLWPAVETGSTSIVVGVAVVVACAALNLRGARAVGGASEWMGLLLLAPFLVLCALAWLPFGHAVHASSTGAHGDDVLGGILVAMWNYMGWDNASTVAGEVERPQRTYPLAMLAAVALVVLTYVAPVAAAARLGLPLSVWSTGGWVDAGRAAGGPLLGFAIVVGGMVCGVGMMNALVMSYSRLPMVMAEDGYLPKIFAHKTPRTGAPSVSIVVLAIAWSVALGLGLDRLILLDVVLYGLALVLEFAAFVTLRLREPNLVRPFRVPGGLPVAVLLGAGPCALLCLAFARASREEGSSLSSLGLGIGLILAGPVVYAAARNARARRR
jgi:amino acid transporter